MLTLTRPQVSRQVQVSQFSVGQVTHADTFNDGPGIGPPFWLILFSPISLSKSRSCFWEWTNTLRRYAPESLCWGGDSQSHYGTIGFQDWFLFSHVGCLCSQRHAFSRLPFYLLGTCDIFLSVQCLQSGRSSLNVCKEPTRVIWGDSPGLLDLLSVGRCKAP